MQNYKCSIQKIFSFFLVILIFDFCILHLCFTPSYALSEKLYFVHTDHLGSIIATTDEQGNVVDQNNFEPYGISKSYKLTAKSYTERQYTGQISDANTALQYYNARYYDPTLGKFISADTVNDGQNRFAYVGGNPVMRNDPSGNTTNSAV